MVCIKAHQDACPDAINEIMCRYPDLWTDTGRVIDVPEESWMQIQLKDGWEATGASSTISRTVRTSFLLINVIDETLDKMHAQGRLEWTQKPVPYAFPVFVEWRVVYKDLFEKVVQSSIFEGSTKPPWPMPIPCHFSWTLSLPF